MRETTTTATIPQFAWGDRMRRVRKNAAMDQGQFASAIGLSRGAIGQHEMRDDVPQSAKLIAHAIQAVFDVDYHWMMTGCDCRDPGTCVSEVTRRLFRLAA